VGGFVVWRLLVVVVVVVLLLLPQRSSRSLARLPHRRAHTALSLSKPPANRARNEGVDADSAEPSPGWVGVVDAGERTLGGAAAAAQQPASSAGSKTGSVVALVRGGAPSPDPLCVVVVVEDTTRGRRERVPGRPPRKGTAERIEGEGEKRGGDCQVGFGDVMGGENEGGWSTGTWID
jgi:hypothetical protein